MIRARARAKVGVQASKTVVKIRYKSFLEYLKTLVIAAEGFGPKSLVGCLENSDLEVGEELGGATERHSQQRQPRPCIEVILALLFF